MSLLAGAFPDLIGDFARSWADRIAREPEFTHLRVGGLCTVGFPIVESPKPAGPFSCLEDALEAGEKAWGKHRFLVLDVQDHSRYSEHGGPKKF